MWNVSDSAVLVKLISLAFSMRSDLFDLKKNQTDVANVLNFCPVACLVMLR